MIPQSVRVSGFLSYKEEQEVNLRDADLWMLAGLNGSGKSSIFDAVTYALFGSHRGGTLNAAELINKDCEKATVDFEFMLGERRYAVYRTLQRTKTGATRATQQIYACQPDGKREPIEETHLKTGYEEWVAQNIGMSFDVFISSVMLRQGDAERLLNAGPAGRHKVLAGIVDLERYEGLHKRASEECKGREKIIENLTVRLQDMLEVTTPDLEAADGAIINAETKYQEARAELKRLDRIQSESENWQKLQIALLRAKEQWKQAQSLLADQATIEKDVLRLKELRGSLPDVQTVIEQRKQILTSETNSIDLDKRRQLLDEKLALADDALRETQRKTESLKTSIVADERRHRAVSESLRQAGKLLEKLDNFERQEAVLKGIYSELTGLAEDPVGEVRKAREAFDEVAAAERAVPLLERLLARREGLAKARTNEKKASEMRDAIQKQGEHLASEVKRLGSTLGAAVKTREGADSEATKAQTLQDHARQQLDDLGQLDGAKVCRSCGQQLTQSHLLQEKAKRKKELTHAEAVFRGAADAQKTARQREQKTTDELTQMERKLERAREEFREQRAHADQAGRDRARLHQECGETWSELSAPFQHRVAAKLPADWLTTTYPTEADIGELREHAGKLTSARRRCEAAEEMLARWNTLKGQETSVQTNLQSLQAELPSDRQKMRGDHARLEAEEKSLNAGLGAKRDGLESASLEVVRRTKERGDTDKQIVELKGNLASEENTRRLCLQTLGRAMQELTESWRAAAERAGMSELFRWQQERDALIQQQTDERGEQLQHARVNQTVLRNHLDDLEKLEQKFPEEARRNPEDVAALVRTAQQNVDECDNRRSAAKQRRDQLASQRKVREQLQKDCLRAERELKYAQLLAKLLSREHLQLYLIRTAEKQVVLYANSILDRLSGGQLFLRLVGAADGEGTGEKALQLEALNRITADKPINVSFLSGSQKFRVAVSLALGLGQYASKGHRPIESVIIDEGFGCLDREGRQSMIQELHNLRGQLKCILLVSHQEEFADAFADGYRFELTNGATRVTRFQR
jgi:DNA repair exonuclease SbcCD ATPase subunit